MDERSFRSVVEMFHHRVEATPEAEAMSGRVRPGTGWYTLTWRETGERVRKVACGLLSLGLERGERVSILAASTPTWVICDLGILSAGGATTTIYTSNTAEECAHILGDSASVCCFVEDPVQAAKLAEIRAEVPALRRVILMTGEPPAGDGGSLTLAELEALGAAWDAEHPGGFERAWQAVGPEDLATLIYTSGTTGKPKGVMLTHDNWVYEGEALDAMGLFEATDRIYLFLPLAHSFAKVVEIGFIRLGAATAIDANLDELIDNVGATRPTVLPGVPRIFEKVYNKVVSGAREAGGAKLKIFQWALGVGREVSRLRQRGERPGGLLALKNRVADKLVFSKLKARFGGRIRIFVSGGAPLAREIAEFFHAADLLVLEGYGLTESSAATCVNRADHFKFGTVGPPVPGSRIEIAEDGEVLIAGRGVMRGYHNLPEATAEALDAQGRLHTGDIGELDEDGFLKITDRKKDIIVTAGGKNIAPQYIENQLKAGCRYVSQAVMLGDRRPYCVALVTINEETVGKWAAEQGIATSSYAELAARPEVQALIWGAVEDLNRKLASYESIKKIHVLERDFSQETGELTPKMSVKRKVVERTWADVLERMYEDAQASGL
ncbi:MAG TPA: long-chain fatty acid--CoA ligase [Thermoanaerobaculia bacterium]|nr:long-chain fatty acid--CoA ligase [Thermoanaerobaculia bacterium]